MPYAPLYGVEAAKFDPRQMDWLGSLEQSTGICVAWATSGITHLAGHVDKEFVVGSSGAGSQMETMPMMLNKLFGTKIKVVSGYKGGNEVYLAMERGEVQGRCGSLVIVDQVDAARLVPAEEGRVPIQIALERDPEFPDVPAVAEFAKDERTKQVLELVALAHGDGPADLTPPGVPPSASRCCAGVSGGRQRSRLHRRGQTGSG